MTESEQRRNWLAVRENLLKTPLLKRCWCGRVISENKLVCAEHQAQQRAVEAGLVLPGEVVLPGVIVPGRHS